MFRVGQRVVCVEIGRGAAWAKMCNINDAQVGAVYTVRASYVGYGGKPSIRVAELLNGICPPTGWEYGFWASRFRPIVERKTSIEIFTKMLTGKRVSAGA